MPNLIRRIKKGKLYLVILTIALLALVGGLPLLDTNHQAEAANPDLATSFKAVFPGYPDGQEGTGEGEVKDYVYDGDPSQPMNIFLEGNGPLPTGPPTVKVNGNSTNDITVTHNGNRIEITLNNPGNYRQGNDGKITIFIEYPNGSCWHACIVIRQVAEWIVSQQQEVTKADGSKETRTVNSYGNGVAFPVVRSEGGSYKVNAGFDVDDGGAGNANYKIVLSGLPDSQRMESAPGVTSADFEYTLPSASLSGYRINLALVNAVTGEKICVTPLPPSEPGGPGTEWGEDYEYTTVALPKFRTMLS